MKRYFINTCGILVLAMGCRQWSNSDVTYTDSIDPQIQNGFVVESAVIEPWNESMVLVLPTGTDVEIRDDVVQPEITLKKKLALYAHPDKPISIDEVRDKLGIMAHRDNGRITIATFGEYSDSHHGGTSISLEAIVSHKTLVLFEDGLCGEESKANHINEKWVVIQTYPRLDRRPLVKNSQDDGR